MKQRRHGGNPRLRWGVALVLALGVAAYVFGVALPVRRSLAHLPEVDGAGMEPQVAARLEAVRQGVRENPRSAAAWGRMAQAFHAHDHLPQAIACYDQSSALDSDDFRWPYLAALAQSKLDNAAAIPYFERAVALRGTETALRIRFGEALLQLGQPERALRQYELAAKADDRSSHALYGMGQIAWLEGDLDGALTHLTRAAELAPQHGEVHALLAQIYQRRGDTARAKDEALRASTGIAQTRPDDPIFDAMQAESVSSRAYTDRGIRLARAQRYAEAEAAFRRVLEIRPGNVRDHANLGGVLLRLGRPAEALDEFHAAVALAPADVDALSGLGLTLAEMGRREEALGHLATALSIDPRASGARHTLGRVRFDEGKVEEAIEHYRDAIKSDPGNGPAHADLALALASGGQLAEAVPFWRRAIELDRFDLAARLSLSHAESRLGRHAEAIRLLRDGLTLAPNSSRFVSLLAWELASAPRREDRDGPEAVRLARRLHAAQPASAEAADILAAALAETGAFDEAASVARQGLEHASADGSGVGAGLSQRLQLYLARRPFRQP